MSYCVYIMTTRPRGRLYVDLTDNLSRRLREHKLNLIPGFPEDYKVKNLVYYKEYKKYSEACSIVKYLRSTIGRNWMLELIETNNPKWNDLSHQFTKIEEEIF